MKKETKLKIINVTINTLKLIVFILFIIIIYLTINPILDKYHDKQVKEIKKELATMDENNKYPTKYSVSTTNHRYYNIKKYEFIDDKSIKLTLENDTTIITPRINTIITDRSEMIKIKDEEFDPNYEIELIMHDWKTWRTHAIYPDSYKYIHDNTMIECTFKNKMKEIIPVEIAIIKKLK